MSLCLLFFVLSFCSFVSENHYQKVSVCKKKYIEHTDTCGKQPSTKEKRPKLKQRATKSPSYLNGIIPPTPSLVYSYPPFLSMG
ncbi:MAG: hypothetical protein J3R72DRAFT_432232 [Linnemannia gamsii]|nr:MAG: hypothetical protein J3R72DRAFT_432232 [Linnemannia gamsii]